MKDSKVDYSEKFSKMSEKENLFKNLSDDKIIKLGVELLKDSAVNVEDAIPYVKVKDNLERKYGNLEDKYLKS